MSKNVKIPLGTGNDKKSPSSSKRSGGLKTKSSTGVGKKLSVEFNLLSTEEGDEVEKHIRILATLVPDEIIFAKGKNYQTSFPGVLLFTDVSGFTELCERYTKMGKGGPSRLTQVLNDYLGAMVQEIISYKGDILKFSGDAFMAMWKSTEDLTLSDIVHAALDCALGIQKSYGTYKTDLNIILRVKIAVAAGPVTFSIIGNDNFMVLGNTMFEAKAMSNLCAPGDIFISSTVIKLLGNNEYITESVGYTHFFKVVTIGSEWCPSYLSNQYELFDIFSSEKQQYRKSDEGMKDEFEDDLPFSSFILRLSIDYAVKSTSFEFLRNFIIPPVLKAIDMNESLDFLTEMRQVVIVFINIVTQTHKEDKLLRLCNDTYRIIHKMVYKAGGCLNKVSLFDKDLMVLVIFGLRGLKHSSEVRRALYSSKHMRDQLSNVNFVETASIGVCTGKTYCGVVGHPMRKEYTVIGRSVNKAARLMCAYPDMVTCDRQTFLASRLQARYFSLQPPAYLKGFKNVGPIYKFDDLTTMEEILQKDTMKTNLYPLLDCTKEMELFFYILMSQTNNSELSLLYRRMSLPSFDFDINSVKMLIITGNERQGKTRFLNEVIYFAEEIIEIIKCTFSGIGSSKYKLYRCMFSEKCRIKNVTNKSIRTDRVLDVLQPFKVPEFLCALNDILLLNFEVTKYYLRLSEKQKVYVKQKMIKYLCVRLFEKKVVLTVDNIDFMDSDSWELLIGVLNSDLVFICVTMGNNTLLDNFAADILAREDVLSVKLQPVQKLFHVGLICQFLNVIGVSVELERYVQIHSMGNPGWIESFLTTLMDSGVLTIMRMTKSQAVKDGYVLPPFNMIHRTTSDTLQAPSVVLIESNETSFMSNFDVEAEGWDLFHQTVPDHEDDMYKKIPDDVLVCSMSPDFNWNQIDTEEIDDVAMLKSYDSLKVAEQQLLKCSSILGDSFSRKMLEYVMQNQNSKTNSLVIKKLFEIRVFCCARGKCTNGIEQIDLTWSDPNLDTAIKCYCIGYPTNKYNQNLPKYANCGYIRFRQPKFREMLCNLLTEFQANLYHVRAIWYLETKTRRCLACGGGYFVNLMGNRQDDGLKGNYEELVKSHYVIKKKGAAYRRVASILLTKLYNFKDSESEEKKAALNFLDKQINTLKSINLLKRLSESVLVPALGEANDIHIKTYVDNALNECNCMAILIAMYNQMINHCQEAELYDKLVNTFLEFAWVSIQAGNIAIVFSLLNQTSVVVETKISKDCVNPKWEVPLIRGQIHLLFGLLNIKRRCFDDAEISLLKALECYKRPFPKGKIMTYLYIKIQQMKQEIMVEYFPHRYIGAVNENICLLADTTSEILTALYILYRQMLFYDKAYLACMWALNEALKSNTSFYIMCQAFTNVITLDIIYTRQETIVKLERMALEMCHKKYTRLEKHEMEAVVKLYGALFCRKCLCVNIIDSLKLGSIVVQLNAPNFGGNYRWYMLPLMLQALIFTYLTCQAAILITQSEHYLAMDSVSNGPPYGAMMYYTLCIEFRLYTTYTIESFDKFAAILNVNVNNYVSKKILVAIEMRYQVALWLWHVRKENWQAAESLQIEIKEVSKWSFIEEPATIYIMLHLLEGLLILSVHHMNTNDIDSLEENKEIIEDLFLKIKKLTRCLTCIQSRYFLLKAYWDRIQGYEQKSFKELELSAKAATQCSSFYEVDWVEHTKIYWTRGRASRRFLDKWQEATETEVFIDCSQPENTGLGIPFYCFPLPLL